MGFGISYLFRAAQPLRRLLCLLQSLLDEPWNWNPYLFVLWCIGVFVRNFILFPIRSAWVHMTSMVTSPVALSACLTSILPMLGKKAA